jgi:FG-GAP-like repeat/ASPIC and UnbV
MRTLFRVFLAGLLCAAVACVAVVWLANPKPVDTMMGAVKWAWSWVPSFSANARSATPAAPARTVDSFPIFSVAGIENAGYPAARQYTGPIADRSSIEQLRAAYGSRGRRGIDDLLSKLRSIPPDDPARVQQTSLIKSSLALLLMYEGKFTEAADMLTTARAGTANIPIGLWADLEALLGVIHLRRGETENCLECVGPTSCIFPITAEAIHQRQSGSRQAIRHFGAYLEARPDDLGVRWLLNVAYMTLGEYPEKVPPAYRISLEHFRSRFDVGRFANIAAKVGLNVRGANMAGGSIFDDFTGDGLPDIMTSSFDADLGASLFVNRGNGTFEDRSGPSGLAAQPLALNLTHGDIDNDGWLDVLLLRGGWEQPARLSLLRNTGAGVFEDVTVASGLAEPIASHSAAWGDYDNDGFVDIFVCGEFATDSRAGLFGGSGDLVVAEPRNRCRLYRNQGNGTFVNVAERAGVCNDRFAKGAAWGDYDADGFIDLFVSNFRGGERLYRNNGDGTFRDVALQSGVGGSQAAFSCWFWDFDNDGRLDLFVNDYSGNLNDVAAGLLGQPTDSKSHPHLFRNLGPVGFREVSLEVGLDRVILAMGSNFGDIDNDGFLDFYLATGFPGYSGLMPNVLFKNVDGQRFEDVTTSSGTGHLQKGHGVSFADWDNNGDLDFFVEIGGAVPGDKAHNVLFQNPGHGRHWLKVKLIGTRSNRAALGARIRVDVRSPSGATRSIYRQVGGASSFGGNTLVESIGLGDASTVSAVTVTWPASRSQQTFRSLTADQSIVVTEGNDSVQVLKALPLSVK